MILKKEKKIVKKMNVMILKKKKVIGVMKMMNINFRMKIKKLAKMK